MARAEPGGYEARLLAGLAGRVNYPPTPDLLARTTAPIAALGAPRSHTHMPSRRFALTAVAVVLAAVALALAFPTSRHAVGEFFGLVPGERIERLAPTAVPTGSPGTAVGTALAASPTPLPVTVPPWEYARPANLADVGAALGFAPALPPGYGDPDGVYLAEWGNQLVLIFEYPDFDLWQTRGGGFVGKGLPDSAEVQTPSVRTNEPAYWIVSGPYDFRFYDAQSREVQGARRTITSHVLIWRGAQSYYRIETELPLDAALAIARTLP